MKQKFFLGIDVTSRKEYRKEIARLHEELFKKNEECESEKNARLLPRNAHTGSKSITTYWPIHRQEVRAVSLLSVTSRRMTALSIWNKKRSQPLYVGKGFIIYLSLG